MSSFSDKSKLSLISARLLANNNLYSSSVNRSYYACFQYIMHILFEKIKMNQDEFYTQVRNRPNGTHSWASKLIIIELAKKPDKEDYKWLQEQLPDFRELRVNADYYPEEITQDLGLLSISKAESIMNVLSKNFK
jgi:uncharacterized protein (UPF0332 family)